MVGLIRPGRPYRNDNALLYRLRSQGAGGVVRRILINECIEARYEYNQKNRDHRVGAGAGGL